MDKDIKNSNPEPDPKPISDQGKLSLELKETELEPITGKILEKKSEANLETKVSTLNKGKAELNADPDLTKKYELNPKSISKLCLEENSESNQIPEPDMASVADKCVAEQSEPEISDDDISYSDDLTDDDDDTDDDDSDISDDDNVSEGRPKSIREKVYWSLVAFWIINIILVLTVCELLCAPREIYKRFFDNDNHQLPLMLIPRARWDCNLSPTSKTFIAQRVIVVQTDTEECDTTEKCKQVLKDKQREHGFQPYNFAVAPTGFVYEVLGWNEPSPMFPETPTMVVAFMGNYENVEPNSEQMQQLKILLSESEHYKYLDRSYTINGRKIKILPNKLFKLLKTLKKYDCGNSDTEDVFVDFKAKK